MTARARALGAALGALGAAGCHPALVGSWILEATDSTMTIGSDGTGRADVEYYFGGGGPAYYDAFEIDWTEEGDKRFLVQMSCFESTYAMPCPSFQMDCTASSSSENASSLKCQGDGIWNEFPFEWKRD